MPIYSFGDQEPTIDPSAWIHPDAVVIGDVHLGPRVTVWPGAVLRADFGPIRAGADCVIEDGVVLHGTVDHTVLGTGVVMGHLAHAQGCQIGSDVLMGSGSMVLDRVTVGDGALIAAGSVVPPGTEVPPGARAIGVPAHIREGGVDRQWLVTGRAHYQRHAQTLREGMRRLD